jgi:hypothetical protein
MFASYQLPFTFDAGSLKADLDRVLPGDWRPHFNREYYQGEWKALALRSTTGDAKQIFRRHDDNRRAVATAVLSRCSYFQEVLNTFQCPVLTARLMSLSAGSQILEHEDFLMGFEYGVIRIHVPIVTDRQVEFFVAHQRLSMAEGEAWYIDFGRPHSVHNRSDRDRVHLVIDCTVNDWLKGLFPAGQVPEVSEVQP